MDRIEENLDMAASMERDAERHREEDFNELADRIKGQLVMYTGEILDLKSEIAVLSDRIAMNQDKFDNAVKTEADYAARSSDIGAQCEMDQRAWENFYNNMSE
jgi:predicted  nucleic acid-binding Zn-ribbon protein